MAGHKPLTYVLQPTAQHGVTCLVYSSELEAYGGFRRAAPCGPKHLLLSDEVLSIQPEHRRLLMRLSMSQPIGFGSSVVLRGQDGAGLVQELVRTGRCYWTRDARRPLQWANPTPAEPAWDQPQRDRHRPFLQVFRPATAILPLAPPLYLDAHDALCGRIETDLPDEVAETWAAATSMGLENALQFTYNLLKHSPELAIPLPPTARIEHVSDPPCVPCLTVHHRTFSPRATSSARGASLPLLVLRLEFDYGGRCVLHSSEKTILSVQQGSVLKQLRRNPARERAAVNRVKECGFVPLEQMLPGYRLGDCDQDWGLADTGRSSWQSLLQTAIPELEKEGWQVDWDRDLRLAPVAEKDWYSELEATERDWFEFEAGFTLDHRKINLLPVVHQYLQDNRGCSLQEMARSLQGRSVTVPLGGGTMAVISGDRFALILRNLFELFDREPLQKNRRLRMHYWRIAEAAELEKLSASPWSAPEKVRKLAASLKSGFSLEPRKAPEGLRGKLRPYQELGLAWLQFLREHELDGILADDMGLGKTVQTLAHLLLEKQEGRLSEPSLVVAPTSVMKSWVDEAARFTPELSVLLLHGPDRKKRFDRMQEADLVLTTYALLRWDAAVYQNRPFSYAILDEAQFIKNHRAQVAQMARNLRSRRRLCLTGTPMENHLGELWSLFHFLMPGFLGPLKTFWVQFRKPIERDGNNERRETLNRRLTPFLLRRTKEEVAPELPAKSEIMQSVELSERQRELYETVRLAVEARIRTELARKGVARSHIIILDALLKLRQLCCDPRLVDRSCETRDSCKMTALIEMLPELVEGGRRILLFSQFTQMLKLIEAEVQALDLSYVKLTGATRDRATPIARFQGGEVPLFLISLRAGGTGLTLTAADTVIHYDPWWNPAVEEQATDRAHRIGQDKPVFVYKLLTAGTVESKILELQERKRSLLAGVLSEQATARIAFNREEIDHLLAPIR